MGSLDEYVGFIEFFDVFFDFFELLLIVFLPSFESCGVNKPQMSHGLVASIYLVPLSLETLSDFFNLLLTQQSSW